jgi:CHASE2 domain-containing sensor protein
MLITAMVLAPPLGSLGRTGPGDEAAPNLPASQWLWDLFQHLPTQTTSPQVRVVEIDEKSLSTFGAWPWSRFDVEALVSAIQKQRPAAIGFDLMFPEPDRLNAAFLQEYYPGLPAAALEPFKAEEHSADNTLGRTPGHDALGAGPLGHPQQLREPAAAADGAVRGRGPARRAELSARHRQHHRAGEPRGPATASSTACATATG